RLGHSALREQLPLIEARREPVAVLHNFPDTLIVLASKPRSKVCHSDVPPLAFSAPSTPPIAVSSWKLAIRGSTMGLHWFRGPKIVVEVSGSEILVTLPGTSLSVVYEKTDENQLLAN